MMQLSEPVSIYQTAVRTLDDGNVVPTSATLSSSGVACNIHRGSSRVQAQAQALGIYATEVAMAYFDVASYGQLKVHWIVLDADNVPWMIRSRPVKRTRFAATGHVNCILSLLSVRPPGLPS